MEELIGEIKTLTDWGLVKGAFDNGLTYLCTSGDTEGEFAVFIDKKEYVANGFGLVDEYDSGEKTSVCTSGDVDLKLISISSSDNNPVFTQSMADNGELPVVGMEFMWRTWGEEGLCTMLGKHGDECWIETEEGTKLVGNITNVTPIDTRTDKEKACDKIWAELDDSGKEYDLRTAMELAYDKWVGE